MHISLTPPQKFTITSLLLVAVMVVATSVTQFSFYRNEIMQRESAVIYDLVNALVFEQAQEGMLSIADLNDYTGSTAGSHLRHSFSALEKLSGVARIKVFNKDQTIVWSDEPRLIGSSFTRNWKDLMRASQGEVRPVFIPMATNLDPNEGLPQTQLIEFYVPFALDGGRANRDNVDGVLALYRSPQEINAVIRDGLVLLWVVTGLGGAILFLALYTLFRSVYFGQRAAESRFAKLSAEHGRLMQLEKLSTMGQLLSEIAHQLNNPLVGVVNLAELAEREADDPSRVRQLLGEVRKAGQNCRDFVQRLLAMSRVGPSRPQSIFICQVARETVAFFRHSLGGHPPVELEAPSEDVALHADPLLIRNALFNLIHNAAQADPDGKVVVRVSLRERDGVPGCDILISDSGPGISPDVKDKMFTPFVTTRQGGTGLGLSIAQHIAVEHSGSIDAENAPEGGARFTLWLPIGGGNT
jgi:signal transduction histidine kinase